MKKNRGELLYTEVLHVRAETAFRGVNWIPRALNRMVHSFLSSITESHLMVEHFNSGYNAKLQEPSCYSQGSQRFSVRISVICSKIKEGSYFCHNFVHIFIMLDFYVM